MKIKLIILCLCIASICYGQQPGAERRADIYIREQLAKKHIAGLSVVVLKDGKIVKASGYGYANLETRTKATSQTVYKIASASKQFIAAGVMVLVQDGRLKLDDKVVQYIHEVPASWNEMTIRELLNHTAGLPLDAPGFEPYKDLPDSVTIGSLFASPLIFESGSKFSYSNADYFVAAEIIRRVSGIGWDLFIQKRLFDPAGMRATCTTTTSAIVPNRSGGYTYKNGKWTNAESWIAVRPSGAFLSTVLDMAKWDNSLFTDEVISSASKKELWSPVKLKDGSTIPYGLGWGLSPWNGHERVFHDGGLPGFSADYEHFIRERLTVVVLCNTVGVEASEIALHVAGIYEPSLVITQPLKR